MHIQYIHSIYAYSHNFVLTETKLRPLVWLHVWQYRLHEELHQRWTRGQGMKKKTKKNQYGLNESTGGHSRTFFQFLEKKKNGGAQSHIIAGKQVQKWKFEIYFFKVLPGPSSGPIQANDNPPHTPPWPCSPRQCMYVAPPVAQTYWQSMSRQRMPLFGTSNGRLLCYVDWSSKRWSKPEQQVLAIGKSWEGYINLWQRSERDDTQAIKIQAGSNILGFIVVPARVRIQELM